VALAVHNAHKSVAVDLISKMVAHFVAVGKTAKHTDMACVQDQKIKELIQVLGIMALKYPVFTHGQGKFHLFLFHSFRSSHHTIEFSFG
jgi:hypothetical protein